MKRLLPIHLLLGLAVFALHAEAQPVNELRILNVDTKSFPHVNVHVRAFCNGVQSSDINSMTVRIWEDDVMKATQSFRCPSETTPISVALALDRSGSVAGTSLLMIKEGAYRFVELFQQHSTGRDEGAIFSFGDDVTMHQGMTTELGLLNEGIRTIYPFGLTALYDAIIDALNEVANNGTNAIKAVIVLTDGGDNNSIANVQDVIARALQLGIPVHCLTAVYHAMDPDDLVRMKLIADATGGEYLEMEHPDEILLVFNSIMSLVTGGANDCVASYTSDCADGSWRDIRVTAEFCGMRDSAFFRFKAPLSPSTPVMAVSFDSTYAYENGDMYIPLVVDSPSGGTLTELSFKVLERPPLRFRDVITTGYLAESATVKYGIHGDHLFVEVSGHMTFQGGRETLLKVRYSTPPYIKEDTSFVYPAFFMDKETVDCLHLKANTNNVAIYKRPVLDLVCGDSLHVEWDDFEGNYSNGEFNVSVSVVNNGTIPVTNPRVRLLVPYGIELLSPSDTQVLQGELQRGMWAFAEFRARVLPVDSNKTFRLCLEVLPDSGVVTLCCTEVTVESAKTQLAVQCNFVERIIWNDSLNSFVPEVFPVRVQVLNSSELLARDIEASIQLPPGFVIDDSTPKSTFVNPSTIGQSDTGWVQWMVRPLERPTSDLLQICVTLVSGLDTAICCIDFSITASPVRVQMHCLDTRIVQYDEGTREYDPERLLIMSTVKNVSSLPMNSARGHIELPPFLDMESGEFATKEFPNGAVIPPGDSATISWVVVLRRAPVLPASICIRVTADNFPGAQCCTDLDVQIENSIPSLTCSLDGPDTIRYVNGDYEPNPATFTVHVRNTGLTPANHVVAALLQGEDISIDASDQALKELIDTLGVGEEVEGTFRIRILDRVLSRNDVVRVTVYAANGGAAVCSKDVYIEAVTGPVLELACAAPDSIRFVDSLNAYQPEPFLVTVDAMNIGTASADSVIAELFTPPDMTLVAGERAAKLMDPSSLDIWEFAHARWFVRATPRAYPRVDTLYVQVKSKGKSLNQTAPCPMPVFVPAAKLPVLELACEVDKHATVDDEVIVRATLRNTGSAIAYDAMIRIELPGKLLLDPGDQEVRVSFDPIAPGEYRTAVWHLAVVRAAAFDSVNLCFEASAKHAEPRRCCVNVDIPPYEQATFVYSCESTPEILEYNEVSGDYPSLHYELTVTNPSNVTIDSLFATLLLPDGIRFAAGETQDKLIRNIAPGDSRMLSWNLRAPVDTATVMKKVHIQARLYGLGRLEHCNTDVVVYPPPPQSSSFTVACSARDTVLFLGPAQGYKPAPFPVQVNVFNTGSTTLTDVRATLTLPPALAPELGESLSKSLDADLAPGRMASIVWLCRALAQTSTTVAEWSVTVSAEDFASRQCSKQLLLYHPVQVDSASMLLSCTAPDSIRYDIQSGTLTPSPFPVSATLYNNGNRTISGITASLNHSSNITLHGNEQSTKALGVDLAPGASAIISWTCVPAVSDRVETAEFAVSVHSDQLEELECTAATRVAQRVTKVTISIPDDILGMMGRTASFPVLLANNNDTQIEEFQITVRGDESLLRFTSVRTEGTLSKDWLVQYEIVPGAIVVEGQGDVAIRTSGTLFHVNCTMLPQDGRDGAFGIFTSELRPENPPPFVGEHIGVDVVFGLIRISGDCVEPLRLMVELRQNIPNPFNPATMITWEVSDPVDGEHGELEVLDMHGRRVALLHHGPVSAGIHNAYFDSGGLPSGMYLARLRVGSIVLTKKMLLSK